ncbi:hypothetical protein GCM10023185_38020 [Hymenobacter saemangeumensis]|uniref:RDD domain-containing protein n=1 Tax=Hymenobacter saemangeumensis TaxID=1084522 RepID=A0ABP8IRH5_9BACT
MTISPPLITRARPLLVFGGLLLLLLAVERLVTTLPVFTQRPLLPFAVTFDLLVCIPALYYWLVVRRYGLPVSSIAAAFGAALGLGYLLIPTPQQQYLHQASHLLVVLEVLTVSLVMVNLRRLVQAYGQARQHEADFMLNLSTAFQQVLGRSLAPLVFEVAMVRYALLGWWAAPEARPEDVCFTGHRESAFTATLAVVCSISLIETAAVHLLASLWSQVLANVLLLLDVYTLLLLLAHGHGVRLRPTLLTPDSLVLRVGFVWKLVVPRSEVVGIEKITDAPAPGSGVLNTSKLLFTVPNLLLSFAEPVEVAGPYGIRRRVRQVALYVDQPQEFMQHFLS